MQYTFQTTGTCSKSITFNKDENGVITNIKFEGGCNGNLKGVGALVEGMEAGEVIRRTAGIRCGMKSTSCPDQLAKALEEAMKNC